MRPRLIIVLTLFLVHCSQEPETDHIQILDEIPEHILEVENLTIFPGDAEPVYDVELISEVTFDDAKGPYLNRVLDAVVDNREQVIILGTNTDYQQSLHAYSSDGAFLTVIGGRGGGPGEYGIMLGPQVTGTKLFVPDVTNQRLNEYSTADFSVIRSIRFEQWDSGGESRFGYVYARQDGNYWLIFSEPRSVIGQLSNRYKIMDHEGRIIQDPSLALPAGFRIQTDPSARPIMPLYFMGSTLEAVSRSDELYTAFTRDFLIRKYDANGIYQSAFYYPVQSLPFDLDVHTNSSPFSPSARVIKNAFSDIDRDLPETNPVLFRLRIDDENRIWAAVPMDQQREILEWWILDESGELLAKLQRPLLKTIFDIKNGYLYGKEIDEETGAEYVVKYRMELEQAGE
ncbi:6-bladed beta-propeller [Rhodohalobacter halophilus]|uniref:6-bladed beta-propeller n=1 Tax=Rhodohalobacter halophilus TaxID=1812810 RepID=UPI00083F546F|nr:6-bladed beta-propeller [Rhodohalobacter halophilus]